MLIPKYAKYILNCIINWGLNSHRSNDLVPKKQTYLHRASLEIMANLLNLEYHEETEDALRVLCIDHDVYCNDIREYMLRDAHDPNPNNYYYKYDFTYSTIFRHYPKHCGCLFELRDTGLKCTSYINY